MRSQPNAMPPCGGAPYLNASSRKPNFSRASLLGDAHHLEDALLDVLAVDTDRPATDLVAVADDVVGVGQRRAGVGVERVEALGLRRGERVVHRGPGTAAHRHVAGCRGVTRGLEHRGVDDPDEAPGGLVDQPAAATDLEPGGAEQRPRALHRAGREEDAVAGLRADVVGQPGLLGVAEVLGDRAAQLAVLLDQHVGQALGAALLGPVLPGVELLAGLGGAARHDDGADVRRLEHPERSCSAK